MIRIDRLAVSVSAIAALAFVVWAIATNQAKNVQAAAYSTASLDAEWSLARERGTPVEKLRQQLSSSIPCGGYADELMRQGCVDSVIVMRSIEPSIRTWAFIKQWAWFVGLGAIWSVAAAGFTALIAIALKWLIAVWWPWVTNRPHI